MQRGRAWSVLEIKSVNQELRQIVGIATTASTDRMGDVVEPAGAQFELPIPLLWQHKSDQPIGQVIAAKRVGDGWQITAQIAQTDTPGALKDRLDMAWQSLTLGLVRGLSIGFQSLEDSYDKVTGGMHFLKWLWLELSAVTIPANADASITAIKTADLDTLAASGRTPSGVPDTRRVVSMRHQDKHMRKPLTEQIKEWEATRAAKAARQSAIQEKALGESRAKSTEESEEFDRLNEELASVDKEIVDLRILETRERAAAVPVGDGTGREGVTARTGATIRVEPVKLEPGIAFTRAAMCLGMSRGNTFEARELARQSYGDHAPEIMKTVEAFGREMGKGRREIVEKSAVAGGSTTGSHYLDDMVPYAVMNDFIEYLRPGSIIGKFGGPNPGGQGNYPALRRVGFNERVSGMSTGFAAAWKGEGLPVLPSAAVTFNTSLVYNNMSALAVLTKEAIRFSNPSAEARVRDDLGRAVNGKLDLDFVDPAKAAVSTTSPASITYGIVATTPTGATPLYFLKDLATLLTTFTAANLDMSDIVLIMSASQALNLSMMLTTLGMPYFSNVNAKGGSITGIPVITSEFLQGVGSPSVNSIIAVKAGDVYLADDGVVTVDASDQASIEMQDTSSQSALSGTGASLVSLWQTGAVGLMATREITWKLRRSTAVGYISPAAYVPQTS